MCRIYRHYVRMLYMIICMPMCLYSLSPKNIEVYFSPHDHIRQQLTNQCYRAQRSIYAAVFLITDQKIIHALIDAKKRGVDVQVVTDLYCLKTYAGKIEQLKAHNIELFIFKPSRLSKKHDGPYMHHKFALIDNDVWTGSYNWTRAADRHNQENALLIRHDLKLYNRYMQEFSRLKRSCVLTRKQKTTGKNQRGNRKKIRALLEKIRNRFGTNQQDERSQEG